VLPLIGILIVIAGFALRFNPLVVVAVAAIATGIAAGHATVDVIGAFGKAFIDSRSVPVVWLALPVIGLLERTGLKERARTVIGGIRVATTGRLLLAYLALRQITASSACDTSSAPSATWCKTSRTRSRLMRRSRVGHTSIVSSGSASELSSVR